MAKEAKKIYVDPVVYPTLQSLLKDIHFKTFLDIEVTKAYTKGYDQIKGFGDLKRSDKYIFLCDNSVYERRGHKFKVYFANFMHKVKMAKITISNLLEEYEKKPVMSLRLN